MGVCVACSSAVADEKLTDSLCPNCSGVTPPPAESPEPVEAAESPEPVEAVEVAEAPVEAAPEEAPTEVPAE